MQQTRKKQKTTKLLLLNSFMKKRLIGLTKSSDDRSNFTSRKTLATTSSFTTLPTFQNSIYRAIKTPSQRTLNKRQIYSNI